MAYLSCLWPFYFRQNLVLVIVWSKKSEKTGLLLPVWTAGGLFIPAYFQYFSFCSSSFQLSKHFYHQMEQNRWEFWGSIQKILPQGYMAPGENSLFMQRSDERLFFPSNQEDRACACCQQHQCRRDAACVARLRIFFITGRVGCIAGTVKPATRPLEAGILIPRAD